MKFLVWLLALFAAAAALTVASHNPGYVQIVYPPYRLEMTLTFFVLALLAGFAVVYMLVRLTLAILRLPSYVRTFREEHSRSKGRAAMMDALTAFFEGRYTEAEKAAVRSMELGEKSGLNPIVAARAAHELREFEKRDAYLVDAENKQIGEATMRLMARTEFQLDQKQPQSALGSLKELDATGARKNVGALALELKAQQQARNWDAVLDVLAQLEKRQGIETSLAGQIRRQAWLEKLRGQAPDINSLRAMWKAVPSELRRDTRMAEAAAQAFLKMNEPDMAARLLTESLDAQWDSALIALYGDCHGSDVVSRIERAERWLKQHADDAGLLLALGKLCLHQELWGKAQGYLEASISLQPSRAAYSVLGQLAERLDKKEDAFHYYHLAMELESGS